MHSCCTGALQLSGLVNCPIDCGNFGRCTTANATDGTKAAAAPQYVCECECGYTTDPKTGRCDISNGYCPAFPSSSSGSIALLANASRATNSSSGSEGCVATGGDAVAATAGTCPAKYGFDVNAKVCTRCEQEGWGGPACKLCQTDDACRVSEFFGGGGQCSGECWVGVRALHIWNTCKSHASKVGV